MHATGRVDVRCDAGHTIVTMVGEFDLANVHTIAEHLERLARPIELDMEQVTFIDSTVLKLIAQDAVCNELAVRTPSHVVRRTFELCGLSHLLPPPT